MAWLGRSLGDSVSSLTGQLSNLTKDILTEGTEEVSDHATELSLAREQIIELKGTQASLRIENDRLKRIIRETEEKAESAELQINSISRQYRTQLEEKEKEINSLKQKQHELLEHSAKEAALHTPGDTAYSHSGGNTEFQGFQEGFDDWSNESWGDFDDSLRLQREINQLRQEVSRLRADNQHWRSVAGQLSQQKGIEAEQSAHHDFLHLQAKVKELEKKAGDSREQAQHELASLQDVHQSKMAALKKRHKEEVTQLKSQVASLEQQLADARDGDSSGAGGSSSVPESERAETELEKTLRAQLATMTQDRDMAQAKQTHLEGLVEELQVELEALRTQRGQLQTRLTALEDDLRSQDHQHQQQLQDLQAQLEEAERWRVEAEQSRQQENQLKSSIAEAGTQLRQTSSDTENLIEELGSEETAERTAAAVNALERENLTLKEQCVKLEEQVTLLEKRAASQQEEWQKGQATIKNLRQELKELHGGTACSSDNTLDQSFTTGTEVNSSSVISQPTGELEEGSMADWEIQKEALEQILAQLRQQVHEKEEQISLLSTDRKDEREGKDKGEIASLREETERLQSELSSLREEKDELETSIGELDDQHQEATNHLIAARNTLQAQLSESQQQVKALQEELKNLTEEQNTPKSLSTTSDTSDQVDHLRKELESAQQEIHTLRQQTDSQESELSELKQKLQKGTLALNDLHMDKKDLEEEVTRQQEEVKAKVVAIKTLREEKSRLTEDNKNLSERVELLEEEVESWEQRNEENQVERGRFKELQDLLSAQQAENSERQQRLDTLFVELDEARTLCRQLQQEREAEDQEVGSRHFLVQERDRAVQERDRAVQDRTEAAEKIAELEKDLTAREKEADPQNPFTQNVEELEAQLSLLQQQLNKSTDEKSVLRDEVLRLKGDLSKQDDVEDDNLRLCHQNVRRALQKRCAALNKLKQDLDSRSEPYSHIEDSPISEAAVVTGECVTELCKENHSLLDALVSGNTVLEEIQQQYYAGTTDSATVFTQSNTSNLHSSPSQEYDLNSRDAVDTDSMKAENHVLSSLIKNRDSEILDLKQSLNNLQEENAACKQSLSKSLSELERIMSEKDNELKILHSENEQLMKVCEDYKVKLAQTDIKMTSLKTQLQETETVLQQTEEDLDNTRQTLEQTMAANTSHLEQKKELESAKNRIQELEIELSRTIEKLSSHKAGIEELNARCADQRETLEMEQAKCSKQEDVIAVLRQTSVTMNEELETVKSQLNKAMKFLSEEQSHMIMDKSPDSIDSNTSTPAIESASKPVVEMKPGADDGVDQVGMLNGEIEVQDRCEQSDLSERHADLLRQVEEKDEIIADLQQNNTTLLQMLEARSLTSQSGDSTQLEVHQLQSEVKALKVEKEQMLAVMNEKSREASSLKAEVMRLMSVVSEEKSALDKLQRDNQELMARPSPPRDDSLEDMTREAMQNLSRLVRDREVEIEALKQKNETLMAVLQDMNQSDGNAQGVDRSGPSLVSHLADKENLEKQVAALQAEREQMVAFVNQKHSESVAYHAEIQRLVALRSEEIQRFEQLQSDFDTLRPQFEDKNQSLLKAQNDLINYRQKYAELEVRYGELLQKSNASETVDAASFNQIKEEKERLAGKQAELQHNLQTREEKLLATSEKLKEVKNSLAAKDSEVLVLKKQVDSLQFQLQGLRNETSDLKQERELVEQQHSQWQEQDQALKDLNSQLTLAVREKEFEVASLQERIQKLTALVSEQQGEKTQVAQLLREQEEASGLRAGLQQEVDQLTLALKQKQQQLNDMHAENLRLKEKEQKLSRELERLRGHLLQIEEGYTREALEAEEREKGLRTRLAHAEEQLASTASQVQSASQQANQQVESLQQQLHSLASQRDAAYMQVASLQDQSQQYASSLANLQLVLEQFQREKESQVAAETERYQEEARKQKEETIRLESELQQVLSELEEASDGLAAASRLSEQLDRKEEALQALREEVHNRETALRNAEEEIRKLTSSKEAKVDRELMKNLLLGYFHTPDRNRMDAIHAIGSVLGFTQDDFHKIEESQGGGWMSSLFRRGRTSGIPTTPVHSPRTPGINQSFSQLFVKFLEVESTPPPAPVRLPAEEMAREVQQHHLKDRDGTQRDKPAFNPFTAPRHVSMPIAVGSAATAVASSGSHLLMAPPPASPTTTFPVFAPFSETSSSSQSSSAILKDVLGSR